MTDASIPRFTGDANPYAGGDPYADHRTADFPFTHLVDLADRRLGAGVIAANDEFFAERENLLKPEPAVFDPEHFGHKGKIMDGWETRRRRGRQRRRTPPHRRRPRLGPRPARRARRHPGHRPGTPHTSAATTRRPSPSRPSPCPAPRPPRDLLAPDVKWTTLVPRTAVGGHAANGFVVDAEQRFTHLRVNQHPDGGIARLRVYGEVAPDPRMARRPRYVRPRGPGERRPGRGRIRPLLLPGHQHHPARPLPQDGRRLGDPPPP